MKHSGIDWNAVKASLAVLGISLLMIAVIFALTYIGYIGVKSWQAGHRWPAFVEGALALFGMFLYGYYQLKDL